MRHLAMLTMFLAWLIYGAMPALGDCLVCDGAAQQAASAMSTPHAMAGMDDMPGHGMMTAHAAATRYHGNPGQSGMGHAPFCAACLMVPPSVAINDGRAMTFSYPPPGLTQPLRDARPAPAPRPPRFV